MVDNQIGTSAPFNSKTIMNVKSIFFLLILLQFVGCSVYTFNPRGKSTLKTIAIQLFENTTGEYGIEDKMTEQVIDAFISDGSIKIVPEENAEALLIGKLISYERKPYDPNENDVVQSYAITMTFEIKLINTLDKTEIWNNNIVQFGVYNIEEETEEDGQQRAIAKLVEDVINKTTKSW